MTGRGQVDTWGDRKVDPDGMTFLDIADTHRGTKAGEEVTTSHVLVAGTRGDRKAGGNWNPTCREEVDQMTTGNVESIHTTTTLGAPTDTRDVRAWSVQRQGDPRRKTWEDGKTSTASVLQVPASSKENLVTTCLHDELARVRPSHPTNSRLHDELVWVLPSHPTNTCHHDELVRASSSPPKSTCRHDELVQA